MWDNDAILAVFVTLGVKVYFRNSLAFGHVPQCDSQFPSPPTSRGIFFPLGVSHHSIEAPHPGQRESFRNLYPAVASASMVSGNGIYDASLLTAIDSTFTSGAGAGVISVGRSSSDSFTRTFTVSSSTSTFTEMPFRL